MIIEISKSKISEILTKKGTPDEFFIDTKSIGILCIEMKDFFDPVTQVKELKTIAGNMFGKKVKWDNTLSVNEIRLSFI